VVALKGPDELAATVIDALSAVAGEGNLAVCLGAGNITAWAHELPQQLTVAATQPQEASG
jgi:UDP-N-acetylmuramate--alanine ligase